MLTTTHILIGAAATTRPGLRPWQITLGWLGGFVPDASVFMMVASTRMSPQTGMNLWRSPDGLYWQQPWQALSAISNSMPLWAGLALAGALMTRFAPWRAIGIGVLVFSAAALLHVMADFPVHTDDAHVHFWPFTEWRFHSPVSYYQRSAYGQIVGMIEMAVGLALAAYLIWRFRAWSIRIMAAAMAVPYFLSLRFLF